jgi:hypothetical protein
MLKTTARLEAKYPPIDPPNLCRLYETLGHTPVEVEQTGE